MTYSWHTILKTCHNSSRFYSIRVSCPCHSYPYYSHTIPMWNSCHVHIIPILYLRRLYSILMRYPCHTHIILIPYPWETHIVIMPYPYDTFLKHTHAIPMSSIPTAYPCRTHCKPIPCQTRDVRIVNVELMNTLSTLYAFSHYGNTLPIPPRAPSMLAHLFHCSLEWHRVHVHVRVFCSSVAWTTFRQVRN